jgi:hypothetical protein
MFQSNGAFLRSSNLPIRGFTMSPKRHDQIAKSREQVARRLQLQEGRDRRNATRLDTSKNRAL